MHGAAARQPGWLWRLLPLNRERTRPLRRPSVAERAIPHDTHGHVTRLGAAFNMPSGAHVTPTRLSPTRLSLFAVLVCSVCLTLRARGALFSTGAAAGAQRSYASFSPAAREAMLRKAAATSAAIPDAAVQSGHPPPPPSPSSLPVHTAHTPPAMDADSANGWKRTLPPDIWATATWFDHERTMDAIFADVAAGDIVWMTFANSAFHDLTLNWVAHVYRLRKERALAIAALDLPFQARLKQQRLPYLAFDHGMTGDMRSDVVGFRRMGALKGALVLRALRAGRHVLMSDVDVVWLRDPTAELRAFAAHADVMSATDCLSITGDERKFPERAPGVNRCAYNPGNTNGHAAFNTGVVYFRPSTAAKQFAAAWRARLLGVEKKSWVDDQLAFNEFVWHGFRNHPNRGVRAATPDGKVIQVRMMQRRGGKQRRQSPVSTASDDDDDDSRVPELNPTPAWLAGWNDLMKNPDEAFNRTASGGGAISLQPEEIPASFNLAPLPARFFCSGHVFWEQQALEGRECASVHTTFVEGGNAGKLWRFREAGLWLLDPPSYYDGTRDRYLTFDPPEPPSAAELAPIYNTSVPPFGVRWTDKYKAGYLVPDALELSPRLRQHLEMVRRHILALRDAMALAFITKRILVLPRLPCLCDRSEGPTVLRECRYEASDLPVPFPCPLTHLFDIVRFSSVRTLPTTPALLKRSGAPHALSGSESLARRCVGREGSATLSARRSTIARAPFSSTPSRHAPCVRGSRASSSSRVRARCVTRALVA